MAISPSPEKPHEGRNVKRIREILGIKQDVLATTLGLNQQAISQLEQKEAIDPALLEQVAKALKVPVEAIKNFSDAAALNVIANTFNSYDSSSAITYNFNPIDKIVELYDALLKSEREKIAMLQRQLEEVKK